MLTTLARRICAKPLEVVIIWIVVMGAGVVFGSQVFSHLDTGSGLRADAESAVAERRLAEASGVGETLTVLVDGRSAQDPELVASVRAAVADLRALPGVHQVLTAESPGLAGLAAKDGQAQVIRVGLRNGLDEDALDEAVAQVQARAREIDAPRVLVGGERVAQREFQEQSQKDLERGEMLALPLVAVLLALIFRGLVGLLLPVAVALVSIAGTLLILLGVSQATALSPYSVNVVTMVGIGLAVDYALLIISRFREERAGGLEVAEAVERAMATAGRTVAFSGVTVTIALAGLLAFTEPFLRSMAWGAIGVVLCTMAAALSLLPALLRLWGRRLKPARAAGGDRGAFYRLSRGVQRFAGVLVPLLVVGLAVLAVPFGHAELRGSGPETLAPSSSSRQIFETLQARFPGGATEPVTVIADVPAGSAQAAALQDRIRALPGVVSVAPRPGLPPSLTVLDAIPTGPSQGDAATGLVAAIRALDVPFGLQVTGAAAELVDYRDSVVARLPLALGLICLATLVLLFLMTGSLVIPVKAVAMNVLSLCASFGALVWIFQDGHLHDLLGFTPVGMIDFTVPVLIFVFAFGLSMDYEVFLLSRIKEAYDETADNDLAVAVGLQRTGRIVTSAAVLIVAVFLGFATGELVTIKELGVGMAIAIVVDATVIRCLLVPAVMNLMGRWNWWAPPPLRRLHGRIAVEERRAAQPPPRPEEPAEGPSVQPRP